MPEIQPPWQNVAANWAATLLCRLALVEHRLEGKE